MLTYFFDSKYAEITANDYLQSIIKQYYITNIYRIQEDYNYTVNDKKAFIDIVVRKNKLINKEFLYDSLIEINANQNLIEEIQQNIFYKITQKYNSA